MFKLFRIIKLKMLLRKKIAAYEFYRNAQKKPGISREDEVLCDCLRRDEGIFIDQIRFKINQLQNH